MAGVIGTWTPPRFCCLVNAEIDPMGGVDGGVGFDTKTSPRQAAIEKAQAELRQEYDVREERRRELEFLEKGGNPLDFKFGLSASISVQSTSITDQLLEHCSEAKGSVALATSPHGDSAESSGRPGAPTLREPNFADNILLLDSETSKVDGKKNGINTDKRKSIASSGQTSKLEGTNSAREEDSAIFRLGVKSQAYARRNRSRSNRDSPHFGPIVLIQSGQGNQANLPSAQPDGGDTKVQHWEAQVDDHVTVCNSKPTSSNENDDSKDFASEVHLGMELDAVKQNEASADLEELLSDKANITSEKLQENNFNEHLSRDGSEQEPSGIIFASSKLVDKGGETLTNGVTQVPCESFKLSESISKSCINSFSNEKAKISHNQDQVTEKCVFQAGGDISMPSGLEAEPTCVKVIHDIGRNATGDHFYSGEPDGPCNGGWKEQKPGNESTLMPDRARDNGDLRMDDLHPNDHREQNFAFPAVSDSHVEVKNEECCVNRPEVHDGLRSMSNMESRKVDGEVLSKPEGKLDSSMTDVTDVYQETRSETTRSSDFVPPICEHLVASLSQKGSAATPEHQSDAGENIKLVKAHEEAILQEARLIETKLKRAGESPLCVLRSVKQRKSHWDYVLEEMAWLANDFMQERLWKITTASQICRMVARSGQLKFEKNNLWQKQRAVAQILAKAVIKFWSSAEENKNVDENGQILQLPIKRYAVRFLQSESCHIEVVPAEAPKTPDRTSDAGSLEFSWEEQLPEELLYYKIPLGAMNIYRKFVETNWLHHEKSINNTNHVDCETSVGDSAAETIMYENMDDDEAETTLYYMPGPLEGNKQKISHKKRKSSQHKAGASRSYEAGFDLPYVPGAESKSGTQPSLVVGKRPSCMLNVGSIPTKRVRTASRQRVVSPFNIATGAVPVTSKTDVSSGETNSFQDDQSTLQGGFHPRKFSEFESTVDFEKQMPFDGNEVSVKPKKKKKPKYMEYKNSPIANNCFASSGKGSSYEQRWPVDSYAQLEQKDHIKKRPESHHFESNGTSGLYMQQATKKPKMPKQLSETSPEALVPLSGPIPSPVASQMSNMSNSNKLTKVIPNRDRGRKSKALKAVGGQSGPGSTWSLFEDQTLVVLVHDMGPNWELISDAINSTVQFKTVFRDPKGCKDRHKILMDKTAGDGADSAEDSGSSQPYPSTLPGIPKGSARQLFQCLQGPMEEDTLKTHFEKIIHIGQKLHSRRIQDNLDSKQISPAHNSHLVALSQACPNNLAGGPLTPLDLCDATTSNSAEGPCLGYQGVPSNGLAIPSYQCPTTPILPASGSNNLLQGSPGMVMGNSFPSPSTAPNAPTRDVPRYGVPRPASLPVDDQQRLQQYGQVISGRNVPGAVPVGADRGVRMLPSANGMGMVCGTSRGMPVTRPGFQGIGSPGVLNMVSSGSMLSSTGVGIANPVNLHPGSGHGQGNSMMRPRDSLQMLRTGQNPEDHRQMMMQELQIQATQGNGQTIASFNGISAPFSNQPIPSPPVQTFPVQQHQQPHQMAQQPHMLGNPHYPHIQGTNHNSPHQQAYAMRMAKERQLQQQRLVQQPPFAGSNGMTPLQNVPQHQQTAQSCPMTTVSSSHAQQKQQNLPRNSQATASMSNQIIKQRQRQQIQQQPPRQQQPAPTQAKLMKGGGRGSILMHQNSPVDASHANGPSATGNQVLEKHMIHQSQSTFSANHSSNSILPQKSNQQKIYGRPPSQSSKQMSAMPSHPDGASQGQVQVPASQALLSSQQSHITPLTSQNQAQRQTNQNHQTVHRVVLHQNHQLTSDSHMRSATDPMQATQMIVASTKSSDSVNAIPDVSSAPVSASQWKPEQSYETSSRTPSAHLSNSSQPNQVGTEPLMPASSQGLVQRQFSGSLPVHGHSTGGPWQQPQLQPQQQQQSYPPHQQMHRQAGQGALYGRPSNSGPG